MSFKVEVDWKVKDSGPILVEAVRDTAQTIEQRSKADVAGNVNNPGRFVKGTTAKVEKVSGGYSIKVRQKPAFTKVWETGGVSVGKPLLWIPVHGVKGRVRKFKGKLIRLPGKQVLMATTGKFKDMIRYIGVSSVTHRKRLHLKEIAIDEANKFSKRWADLFRK
jgi:hypothetical protein